MRKSLYGLLVLLLLLAACGGTGTGTDQAEEPAEDTAAQEEGTTEDTNATEEEVAPEGDATEEEVAPEEADSEASAGDCASPDVLCVGLVTDVGRIDDKSFNQSAWEGVQRAEEELGATVDFIETANPGDYSTNIQLFAEQDYDVIVTVGFALAEATNQFASEFPDTKFIGVDQFQAEPVDNIAGLIFNEDKAGFLAGALAAQMTESGTIASVLGTELVPPVVAFKEGFDGGVAYIDENVTIISTYHPGGLDVAFTDPEWGATTARQALDQGADIIFGAGGTTGNGALIETAGQEGTYCIGVDTDQWETVPEAHPCLISSAMKLITPGVFDLVQQAQDDTFPSGNYFGDVGLAPFHDFDSEIPDEVKTTLEEIEAGLLDGSIETGYNPGG
ncbi:MAG: BMP family ABC transporter substrate-binding protein [Chloroflexota bacterium]